MAQRRSRSNRSDASFGAVVTGLTLAELDDEAFAALYRTWLDYALLIFPGQHLTRRADRLRPPLRRAGVRDRADQQRPRRRLGARRRRHRRRDQGAEGQHGLALRIPPTCRCRPRARCSPPMWCRTRAARPAGPTCAPPTTRWTRPRRRASQPLSAYHSLRYSQGKLGHMQKPGSAYSRLRHGRRRMRRCGRW